MSLYRTCSIIRPPFLHRSSAKKKGGGRLIEVCTNAPNLRPPPPPPPPHAMRFPGNSLYCAAHAEPRGCHKITIIIVHNSQTRDGRIVGHVPQNWQDFLVYTQLGYVPNNRSTKTIRRQRTGCLFLVPSFTSSAARQITWKSCSPYFHKLRR